ncbi:hypothetical protein DFH08DRAFT_963771 [Mycena albidolilacea]|uniref:Zn(2)-C6 fungal-type domain-containing protein n=1 Tax=Mycena albidolilacea TaxID=1033008 RepID=A0AAD6ZTY9_9AGAR|nr:hypothetical protein DFH08DRAFT_963771 [Mycena albidolilacea]
MSDPFEQTTRVAVACRNCRERKVKCMTTSQEKPCMRCERNELECQYVSIDKQKARGSGSKPPGHSSSGHPPRKPFPQAPPINQSSNSGGDGQIPFYGCYDNHSSAGPQYAPSVPPALGDYPYNNSPSSSSPSYRPHSQRANIYPSVPSYDVAGQYGPGMSYLGAPGTMQSAMYAGQGPSQQAMNPSYPTNYGNYSYDWNTSNQSR